VVLLPGAGATAAIWRSQLRAIRRRVNVVLLDLPGHGRSPRPAPTVQYSFESIAGDVLAVLDDAGIASAHFVALSLGALIAETIARVAPSRVSSLVLIGGVARLDAWALLLMHLGRATQGVLPYMVLYRFFAWTIMPGPRHRDTRRLFRAQARGLTQGEFLRWYAMTGEVQSVIRSNAARPAEIPSLYVMGQEDYMFRRHALARAQRRADTEVAVIPRAGHVCNVEQPEDVNRVILDFIGRSGST
jgi:pimeloyl-ACP methyl ester carboxylesterase